MISPAVHGSFCCLSICIDRKMRAADSEAVRAVWGTTRMTRATGFSLLPPEEGWGCCPPLLFPAEDAGMGVGGGCAAPLASPCCCCCRSKGLLAALLPCSSLSRVDEWNRQMPPDTASFLMLHEVLERCSGLAGATRLACSTAEAETTGLFITGMVKGGKYIGGMGGGPPMTPMCCG